MWLESPHTGAGGSSSWTVVRAGQTSTCLAELPAGWYLRDVAGDLAVATAEGPLGIPQVVTMDLIRSRQDQDQEPERKQDQG